MPKKETSISPIVLAPVVHSIDINGKEHSAIPTQVLDLSDTQHKRIIDSLAKIIKVKDSQIKGLEQYVSRIDTTFVTKSTPVYIGKDTAYKVSKVDAWVNIEAIAGKDTGSIHFSAIDTLTRTEVHKTPLIGKSKTYVDLTNASPYVHVVEGYSFHTVDRQATITIGPYVGYDPIAKKPSVGISIQYPIIKLYLGKK